MRLKKGDLEKAREIKTFLEKNIREHYSYDDLVQKFGMNKFKLKVVFKAVANETVHEYITRVRIRQAIQLLENTDQTIGCISYSIGLDQTNFNIQFKKLTGKTPSEWRKEPGSESLLFTT